MFNKQNLSIYFGLAIVTTASVVASFIEFNPWFDYGPAVFIHNHFKFFFPFGWGAVAWGLTKNPIISIGVMGFTMIAGLTLI